MSGELRQPTHEEILDLVRKTGKLFERIDDFSYSHDSQCLDALVYCRHEIHLGLVGGLAGLFYTGIPGGSVDDIDIVGLSEEKEQLFSLVREMGYSGVPTNKYFIERGHVKIPTHYSFQMGNSKIHIVLDSFKSALDNWEYDMREAAKDCGIGTLKYGGEAYIAAAIQPEELLLTKLFKPINPNTPRWYVDNEKLQLEALLPFVFKPILKEKFQTLDDKIKTRVEDVSNSLIGETLSRILK